MSALRLPWETREWHRTPKTRRKENTVTVCIAAICDSSSVVVAADRMMSAGDIEFESTAENVDENAVSKIVRITTSIVVMTAGDTAFQTEAMHHVSSVVQKRVTE